MRPDRLSLGPLTVDEYLEREASSDARHEFVAGRIYAMTGTTARHNLIVSNVLRAIGALAAGDPCRVYFIDLKVRAAADRIYYPDLVVACAAHAQDVVVLDSPCFIVEVASPSTRRTDRGEKLDAYLKLRSLLGYLVVEQDRRHATLYERRGAVWRPEEFVDSGIMRIPWVDGDLSLDDVHADIDLPQRVREEDGEWLEEPV